MTAAIVCSPPALLTFRGFERTLVGICDPHFLTRRVPETRLSDRTVNHDASPGVLPAIDQR